MTQTQDDYDSPWKEAIQLFFPDFLRFFFPNIDAEIDWNRDHHFIDQELHKILGDSAQGKLWVDALVEVYTKAGNPLKLQIHIEIQSQVDPDLPSRMFTYNHRVRAHYNCPVVSLAILGDTSPNWRPNVFEEKIWGCEVTFRFPSCKLLDYPITPEMPDNPFSWLVAAHMHTKRTKGYPEQRITIKLSLVKKLMLCGQPVDMIFQLLRLVHWLLALPPRLEYNFDQEISKFQEEHKMPYMTSWEKRGHEKGLLEGRQEGLLEGRQEGLLEGKRESALNLLKLGVISADQIFAATGLRPEDLNPPADLAKPASEQ